MSDPDELLRNLKSNPPKFEPIEKVLTAEMLKQHRNTARQARHRFKKLLDELSSVQPPKPDWDRVRRIKFYRRDDPRRKTISIPEMEEYVSRCKKIIKYLSLKSGYDYEQTVQSKIYLEREIKHGKNSLQNRLYLQSVEFTLKKIGVPLLVERALEALIRELETRRTGNKVLGAKRRRMRQTAIELKRGAIEVNVTGSLRSDLRGLDRDRDGPPGQHYTAFIAPLGSSIAKTSANTLALESSVSDFYAKLRSEHKFIAQESENSRQKRLNAQERERYAKLPKSDISDEKKENDLPDA